MSVILYMEAKSLRSFSHGLLWLLENIKSGSTCCECFDSTKHLTPGDVSFEQMGMNFVIK